MRQRGAFRRASLTKGRIGNMLPSITPRAKMITDHDLSWAELGGTPGRGPRLFFFF